MTEVLNDEAEIAELIARQFNALRWDEKTDASWHVFAEGFHEDAHLYASARPARSQSVGNFINRMKELRKDGTLAQFREEGAGLHVAVFGNVAIAAAGCEMHENEMAVTQDISAFLLVKDQEGWRIVAQAWDIVSDIAGTFERAGLATDPQEHRRSGGA